MTQADRIGSHDMWVEDIELPCGYRAKSGRCDEPATTYIQRHMLGACRHPSLNDDGNLEVFICTPHLASVEADTERVIRQYRRRPWYLRWFIADPSPSCPSCFRPVMHSGDILQVVQSLTEGNTL